MKILDLNPSSKYKTLELNSDNYSCVLKMHGAAKLILRVNEVPEFSIKSEPISKVSMVIVGVIVLILTISAGGAGYWQYQNYKAKQTIENAGFEVKAEGLLLAVAQGHIDLIPAFTKLGFLPSKTNGIIESALLSGKADVVKEIFSDGAKFENEQNLKLFFPIVIKTDDPVLLAALISGGASPDKPEFGSINISEFAAKNDKWEIEKWIIQSRPNEEFSDAEGNTTAHYLVRSNSPELIASANDKWKLDFVSVKNTFGETPLHFAAKFQKPKSILTLLKMGADPLLPNSLGLNPLQQALASENDEVIASFITAGKPVATTITSLLGIDGLLAHRYFLTVTALVNSGDIIPNDSLQAGGSVLSAALLTKNKELVALLLEKGADPNASFVVNGVSGVTPLMVSCIEGMEDITALLLSKGARKDAIASNGLTPNMAAETSGNLQIVSLLSK